MMIPGWTLITADPSDIVDSRFSTTSGSILWTMMGNPHDIGLVHRYALAVIILGITIAVYGLLAAPEENDPASSLVL
jgi:hypothetical protein